MVTKNSLRTCLLPTVSRLLLMVVLLPLAALGATNPSELLDSGRADDALHVLTAQARDNNAAAFNYLGRVYFALGDWDNAVQNCERAAQIEPNNALFQLWLGRSYGEKANSSSPISAYLLARKTVAAFFAARTLDRKNVAIFRDLAEYYSSAPAIVGGGNDKALALAAEFAPDHPADAAWVRAMVATNQGDYPQAEHEYIEAIRLDHDSARTYLDFARYLRGRKSWQHFEEVVGRAVDSRHILPTDHYDAAELLLSVKRDFPLAAQQMRTYIQSGHTDEAAPLFRAHFLLGEILLKSGDRAQAAAEYRAALALASSYRPASESLRRLGQR